MASAIQISHSFYSEFLLLGSVLAFVFSGLQCIFAKQNIRASYFLAIILASLGIHFLHQYAVQTHYIFYLPALLGINTPIEYLFGPSLYLYVRSLTTDTKTQKYWPHFVLPLVSLTWLIPFILSDFDAKWPVFIGSFLPSSWPEQLTPFLLFYFFTAEGAFFSYLLASFYLLFKHRQRVKNYYSYTEKVTLSWLFQLLVVLTSFSVITGLLLWLWQDSEYLSSFFQVVFGYGVLAIIYVGIGGLLQPNVALKVENEDEPKATPELIEDNTEKNLAHKNLGSSHNESTFASTTKTSSRDPQTAVKYAKSALTHERQQQIFELLQQTMIKQQCFLQANLTLPMLAQQTKLSANYISQSLNEYGQISFIDFVQQYRVQYAKQILIEQPKRAIVDIAFDAGFNSKSAFYSAFKKFAGCTPSQFRKSSQKL